MQHLDPDRLVLLALAERTADEAEAVHLAGCADCRSEIDALKHVAAVGAETQNLADLPRPPDRVWAGIAAQTQKPAFVRAQVSANRKQRRWLAPILSAAAAAILAVAGTVAVIRPADRPAAVDVTAEADLSPLPLAPRAAHGDARVLAGHQLRLDVTDLPNTTGYYQVWLMNPDDLSQMVPVGILGTGPDSVLPISPTTDLSRYRLIDISAQPYGGNGTHSGKSLLRGTLS